MFLGLKVAPFMGAWIEISNHPKSVCPIDTSHPSWVRGLKSGDVLGRARRPGVAPFMGAWIEILDVVFLRSVISVAPFMGAWIEIEQRRHGGQT